MRKRALILASLTTLAFAGVTTAASATTIKTLAGATVANGASIAGTSSNAHLEGGSAGDIDCSSAFSGSLGTNGQPVVSGSLTSLTFSGCTDTIPFVTVSSVTTNVSASSPKNADSTYVGAASTFAISGIVATVTFSNGSTCIYKPTTDPATAQHNSLTSPWNNDYTFTNVPLTKTGGTSFACPSSNVTWSAMYDATSGGAGITIQP